MASNSQKAVMLHLQNENTLLLATVIQLFQEKDDMAEYLNKNIFQHTNEKDSYRVHLFVTVLYLIPSA